MPRDGIRELTVTPGRRYETGCIATLTRDGERRCLHFVGAGSDALRAVADYCDAYGYRVVTVSTPQTIYRDLQGSRETANTQGGDSWFYAKPPMNDLDTPEAVMLGKIGRTDLLA